MSQALPHTRSGALQQGAICTWRFQEGLELARIRQPGGVGNDSELRTAQRVSENVKPWHLRSLWLQAFSLSLP